MKRLEKDLRPGRPRALNSPSARLDFLHILVEKHAFSDVSKEKLEEAFLNGRDVVDNERWVLFAAKALIDKAPTKKAKLAIYKEANYPEVLENIASGSLPIGIKKAVEGETTTQEEKEAVIRARWTERGMAMGMTRERAERAINNNIKFTKRVQNRVGASENPPAGGLRALYEQQKQQSEESGVIVFNPGKKDLKKSA